MGAQLAVDTTLVSVLKRDGSARVWCANVDSASLVAVRRRKEVTYPELVGRNGRTKQVVLDVTPTWSRDNLATMKQARLLRCLKTVEPRAEPRARTEE